MSFQCPTESDGAINSGGYGSNGADGATAGNVFITVHDDDTDLLVPLEYDVRGGAGGASGEHGEPGDGGVGGRGGAPHAWCVTPSVVATIPLLTLDRTERHHNSVSAHTRPGGTNGSNGSPGNRAATYLTSGKASELNVLIFLDYLVADFFAGDRKVAFRLRSFVVTCRRPPTQAHIPFRLSNLTLLMRTKTASMNPASTLLFTTFASEMLEACHLLGRDPYVSSFRVPNSWSPSPQSPSSCPDLFNRDRKWTCLAY